MSAKKAILAAMGCAQIQSHFIPATASTAMSFKTVIWDQRVRKLLKKTNAELLNKLLEKTELAAKQLVEMTLHRLMATNVSVLLAISMKSNDVLKTLKSRHFLNGDSATEENAKIIKVWARLLTRGAAADMELISCRKLVKSHAQLALHLEQMNMTSSAPCLMMHRRFLTTLSAQI